jgi:hypothetical protein
MKKDRNAFLIILMCAVFICCRKNQDCSTISFRTGEDVLASGVWRIFNYAVDGIDSTQQVLGNPNYADLVFEPCLGTDEWCGGNNGRFMAGILDGIYAFEEGYLALSHSVDTIRSGYILFDRDSTSTTIWFNISCIRANYFKIHTTEQGVVYQLEFENVK